MEPAEIKERKPEKAFGGVWVQIGDEKFLVAPLSFKSLRELKPMIEGIQVNGTATDDQIESAMEINFIAVSRNYPSLTREEFSEKLDVLNVRDVTQAVLEASGLRRVVPGEVQAP